MNLSTKGMEDFGYNLPWPAEQALGENKSEMRAREQIHFPLCE